MRVCFKFFAKYLREQRKTVFFVIIIQFLLYVASNSFPFYTQLFIDKIIPERKYSSVLIFSSIVIVTMVYVEVSQYYFNKLYTKVKMKLSLSLDNDIFGRIFNAKMSCFSNGNSSFIVNRLRTDINVLVGNFDFFISYFIPNMAMMLWILNYSFYVNKWIFFIIVILFYPIFRLYKSYFKKHREKILKLRDIDSGIESYRYETIAGLRTLRVHDSFQERLDKYKNKYNEYVEEGTKISVIQNNPNIVTEVLMEFLPMILVFTVGGYFLITSDITLGQWIALNMYSGMFIRPATNIASIGGKIVLLKGTINRLKEYLDLEQEDDNHKSNIKGKITDLTFSNVNFTYPDGTRALESINFKITSNKIWVLVGNSGCGKSTLASLISGLFEPTSGTIYYNEYNIKDISKSSLRKKVALISINDYVFSESIYENIKIGNSDSKKEDIEYAINQSVSMDFISNLENNYDTKLGDDGLGISEGQKQRIILSRAFLKSSDIIIFDEVTSSLDSETEKKIIMNIKNHFKNAMLIFITHHPSIIELADSIIVMKDKQVLEINSHKNLIENCSYYRAIYERGKNNET